MTAEMTDPQIIVGRNLFGDLKQISDFGEYSSGFLLTDSNVFSIYSGEIRKTLREELERGTYLILPASERNKSLEWVGRIGEKMLSSGLDRRSLLVALGGGVVTDIGGLTASMYMRGIDFVNVPTTLVGQIDASLGGKCGVNLGAAKNIMGLFSLPRKVIVDTNFLNTLTGQQVRDGVVEILKIAAVADPDLFARLESIHCDFEGVNGSVRLELIKKAARLKLAVVKKDFRENGYRMVLNFGHTTGHAIEACAGYGEISHGQATAVGILVAAELSDYVCGLAEKTKMRLKSAAKSLLEKTDTPGIEGHELWDRIQFDKKKVLGNVKFALLENLGKPRIKAVSEDQFLCAYDAVYGEISG